MLKTAGYGAVALSLIVTAASWMGTRVRLESAPAGVKAFPTAEGFGAISVGGRGGRVIEVTTLNDAGAGSLRHALEVETGPRIVVFRVSGTIELASDLRIRGEKGSFVTIAGQTSPGGVQLKGDGFTVMDGAHDIILRHLRIRPGAHLPLLRDTNGFVAWGNDGTRVYNIIVDHCSLEWSTDQNGPDAWHGVTDYTSQWNLIRVVARQRNRRVGALNAPTARRASREATSPGT
jgi:pectate lyase